MGNLVRTDISFLSALAASMLVASAPQARADSFTLDLSTALYFDGTASTGVWNTTAQQIQAPLAAGGTAGNELNAGDGSDGVFLDGPNQTGITVAGATITFNTDVKSIYNFTSFTLNAGKTVYAIGTIPLRIRVLGAVNVGGAITMDGQIGTPNGAAGPNSGGAAGAGGGAGGIGFSTGAAGGTAGSDQSNGEARGGAFGTSGVAPQGGGGGCLGAGPDAGQNATASAGGAAAGNCTGYVRDNAAGPTDLAYPGYLETTLFGGGGGGGGGANTGTNSGAGGGGGGGAIQLAAIGPISITNAITSRGGQGGATIGAVNCGGGGGGGSGGTIWLQSATSIGGAASIVDVSQGLHYNASACGGGAAAGGNGSRGIARFDTPSGTNTIASVFPATALNNGGDIADNTLSAVAGQTYIVYSKPIQISHAIIGYGTPVETPGCGNNGSLNVTYSGSTDGTAFGAEVPGSQMSQLNDYPYIRFKVTIAPSGANPPCLAGLQIPWTLRDLNELRLAGGLACATLGGSQGGKGPRGGSPLGAVADLALLGIAALLSRLRIRALRLRTGP